MFNNLFSKIALFMR